MVSQRLNNNGRGRSTASTTLTKHNIRNQIGVCLQEECNVADLDSPVGSKKNSSSNTKTTAEEAVIVGEQVSSPPSVTPSPPSPLQLPDIPRKKSLNIRHWKALGLSIEIMSMM